MFDEYYRELMAPFKHWWLVDDPAWVEQRNKDWEVLEKNCYSDDKNKEEYELYFKTGEKENNIPENTQFMLTPIPSADGAREFFLSKNFSKTQKQNLMSIYLRVSSCARDLAWYREHVKFFSDGVLGDEYKQLKIKTGRKERVYTPEPTDWAGAYVIDSIIFLREGEAFPGLIESITYFISCLAHANNSDDRKLVKMNALLEVMDHTLANAGASDIAKEFAEKLKSREADIKANWALNAHLEGNRAWPKNGEASS